MFAFSPPTQSPCATLLSLYLSASLFGTHPSVLGGQSGSLKWVRLRPPWWMERIQTRGTIQHTNTLLPFAQRSRCPARVLFFIYNFYINNTYYMFYFYFILPARIQKRETRHGTGTDRSRKAESQGWLPICSVRTASTWTDFDHYGVRSHRTWYPSVKALLDVQFPTCCAWNFLCHLKRAMHAWRFLLLFFFQVW